jgi:hypothetical protein
MTDVFAVCQCDLIRRLGAPQNERMLETGFATAGKAMDRANELRRADRHHSYLVGLE